MIDGMNRFVKVAISLPEDLLGRVDRARRVSRATRSEYFREALRGHLATTGQTDVERYVQGYRADPETAAEVAAAETTSSEALASFPWE